MRNMTIPARAVSFEDALRNLASKLTGKPASALPRTQEGVVQYMAEHIPSPDELAETVTCEVLARMSDFSANDTPTAGADASELAKAGTDAPDRPSAFPCPRTAHPRPRQGQCSNHIIPIFLFDNHC